MMEKHDIAFISAKEYEIDFSKVKKINDVSAILKGLDIKVYDNYKNFDELKPFLKKKVSNQ